MWERKPWMDPFINQGTAFSQDARIKRKLRGLLPPRVTTLEHQAKRALERIRQAEEPLQKYEILSLLRHRNATLFYYLLENNIEELMPIVYTPTVGKACQEFDRFTVNRRAFTSQLKIKVRFGT